MIYAGTFAALMLLLAITVGAAYVDLGRLNLPVAMGISIAKTVLIILFFMHVRQGKLLTCVFAGAGFFWLAMLLLGAMGDYATRHWQQIKPF